MKFKNFIIKSSILPSIYSLRIELDQTDADRWNDRQIKQIPKPVLGAFADHLHTIASLFSSLIGTGSYKDPQEDALDCQHTEHGFGPYCMISYDENLQCYEEFGCEFYDSKINFNNNAKLCCFKDYENLSFENTFIDVFEDNKDQPIRLFQSNQNNVGNSYTVGSGEFVVKSGHFGIAEMIYVPNPKPTINSIIFPTWSSCPFDDAVGYHSSDLLPTDYNDYKTQSFNNDFIRKYFSMCTVEIDALDVVVDNKDVRTLMPYCTFKLIDQDCPNEAPLEMSFGHKLPNDNLFSEMTFIDYNSVCCAKSTHDTHETTIINIDYLKNDTLNSSSDSSNGSDESSIYDYFNSRYQVLKWPHANCAEFEYPKFDLTVNKVILENKQTYPFNFGDMELTFCTYTKPLTIDDIFSPTSSFDQTLSEIEVSTEDENNILTRRCEEDDDCWVPTTPSIIIEENDDIDESHPKVEDTIIPDDIEDINLDDIIVSPTKPIVNLNELPSIVLADDHVPEYFIEETNEENNNVRVEGGDK